MLRTGYSQIVNKLLANKRSFMKIYGTIFIVIVSVKLLYVYVPFKYMYRQTTL